MIHSGRGSSVRNTGPTTGFKLELGLYGWRRFTPRYQQVDFFVSRLYIDLAIRTPLQSWLDQATLEYFFLTLKAACITHSDLVFQKLSNKHSQDGRLSPLEPVQRYRLVCPTAFKENLSVDSCHTYVPVK